MPKLFPPTVFYLTHPKAGSQWVKRILHAIAPRHTRMDADAYLSYFFKEPLRPGVVYPTLYTSRETFDYVVFCRRVESERLFSGQVFHGQYEHVYRWNLFLFGVLRYPYRAFFVMRDLRDTLVSYYFSMRYSHQIMREEHEAQRKTLSSMSLEEGLLFLTRSATLKQFAMIQESWMGVKDVPVFRYEDLVEQPETFEQIVAHCRFSIPPARLREILAQNSFEALTGRKRGEEDPQAHFRKGVPGDWRNYFTPAVKEEFKKRFGQTLIVTGYEKDLNW